MTRTLTRRLGLLGGAACIALATTALPVRVDLREPALVGAAELADDDRGGHDRSERGDDRGRGRSNDDRSGDHRGNRGGDDHDHDRGGDDHDHGRGRGRDDDHNDDRGRGRGWDDDGERSGTVVTVVHKDGGRSIRTEYGSLEAFLDAMFGDDRTR